MTTKQIVAALKKIKPDIGCSIRAQAQFIATVFASKGVTVSWRTIQQMLSGRYKTMKVSTKSLIEMGLVRMELISYPPTPRK